jgi:hypothetical protein
MNRRHLLPSLLTLLLLSPCALAVDPKPVGKSLSGTILSCQDSVLLVTVGESKLPVAVALEPDTLIMINGAPAKLADIKPDGQVTIHQIDGITKRLDIRYKKDGR